MGNFLRRFTVAIAMLLVAFHVYAQGGSEQEIGQGANSPETSQYVTGKELMTEEERAAMRQSMQAAATEEERMRLRAANHAKMAVRAQERGLILRPSPNHQAGGKHHRQGGQGKHAGPGHVKKAHGKPQTDAVTDADIGAPQEWGSAKNVVKVKHLYFSEQPDAAGISEAQAAGVQVVINLRGAEEMDWDEAAAVTQAGLVYYQVPIIGDGPSFDRESMQRVSEIVKKHHGQPVLLHCSSGNRASAWLAVHLVQDHDMDVDRSLTLARKSGLTKPVVEDRVRAYLSERY